MSRGSIGPSILFFLFFRQNLFPCRRIRFERVQDHLPGVRGYGAITVTSDRHRSVMKEAIGDPHWVIAARLASSSAPLCQRFKIVSGLRRAPRRLKIISKPI
jgi:hypothetical protein